MPPKISAAMTAAPTIPTHFGMKIPAGRSPFGAGAAVVPATGAVGAVAAAATGAASVGSDDASGAGDTAAAAGAGATSSSSPACCTASSQVNGLVSAVGLSSDVAGDGSPSD